MEHKLLYQKKNSLFKNCKTKFSLLNIFLNSLSFKLQFFSSLRNNSFPFTRSFISESTDTYTRITFLAQFLKFLKTNVRDGKRKQKSLCKTVHQARTTSWRCRQKDTFQREGTWSKSRIRVQDKGERRLSRGEGEVLEFSACGVVSPGCKTTCKTCARDAFCQLRFWPYLHGKSIEESVKNTTNRATNSNYDTNLHVNYV